MLLRRLIQLPPLPEPRLLAFDESCEIKGYGRSDMREYAEAAVRQANAWWRRLLLRIATKEPA